jgi:NitT/TauT family transport system permease protein
MIVFFPIAIATMVGIRSTDPQLREMLRSLGATPAQETTRLEIPSALPVIFGGLRVGVTLAVIGAVVAEWVSASTGLGVLINIADQGLFDTPLMFVALAALAILGLAFYSLVVMVERRVVHTT